MARRIRKAVFPVAGLGTRFLPATKSLPKELLPVVDKPLIHYALDEAREAGIDEFVFVTARGKTAMEDHFDRRPEVEAVLEKRGDLTALAALHASDVPSGKLMFVRQQEALGLGHAVWCARGLVGDEPFAVLLPDDIVLGEPGALRQLVDAYERLGGGHIIAVQDVPREQTRRYGILDPDGEENGLIRARGFVEKPSPDTAPSTLAAIGRYVLDPVVFRYLDRQAAGSAGEIQLTDAIAGTAGVAPIWGCPFTGRRYDCGDKLGFLEANIAFALARDDLRPGLTAFLKSLDLDKRP